MWREIDGVFVYGNSAEGAEITPIKNGFNVYVYYGELEDEGFAKTREAAENLAYHLLDELADEYNRDDNAHDRAHEEDWR